VNDRPLAGWSLRRRFAASVIAAGLLVTGLTVLVVVTFVQVGRSQERITRTVYQAVNRSTDLFTAHLDQETGVRGYLLTRQGRFLDPYTAGVTDERQAADGLHLLLDGDPELRDRLNVSVAEGARWRREYADPAITEVRSGRRSTTTDEQLAEGKQLFDRVRVADDALRDALQDARNRELQDVNRGRTVLALAFSVLALFVVLALVGLGVVLTRWILAPLDRLRSDVGQIAGGELEHAISSDGPPDLRQVADDVERMRRRLRRSYHDQVAATETVERQRLQLERQTDDLRRSNTELEQFAYVASHDLQEPLRKVASFTELLQRRYAGQLDDRADSYIEFAVDGARRMQRLINDLLAFSRVGRIGVNRSEVPLAEALRTAERNLSTVIEETGATVVVESGDGTVPLPTVTGDPGLFAQVFQNLISNAMKFRREGVPPEVRVSCRPDDEPGGWRIDVADNGIGIEQEYADRIFVIFSRLNRREDYPGTGIGLALVKKIVEFHGGRIWLGDRSGPGTTISFTLPAESGDVPEGAE
jgi:signal transduction histidine kinase